MKRRRSDSERRTAPRSMIEVHDLTMSYGDKSAANHLIFNVCPGHVTGFLGANGAGPVELSPPMVSLASLSRTSRPH